MGIGSRSLHLDLGGGALAISTHFLGADGMRAVEATLLDSRTAPPEDIQAFAPATSREAMVPERVPNFTIAA